MVKGLHLYCFQRISIRISVRRPAVYESYPRYHQQSVSPIISVNYGSSLSISMIDRLYFKAQSSQRPACGLQGHWTRTRRQEKQRGSDAPLEAKIELKFPPCKAGIGNSAQLNKCLHLLV